LRKNLFNTVQSTKEYNVFIKNRKFRKWRFKINPLYDYDYINIADNIFSVFKIFIDPVTKKSYGDIKCDIANVDMLRELFIKTCLHLEQKKIDIIATWALPHTPLFSIVRDLGFQTFAQERYFCIKTLHTDYDFLYDIRQWNFVQADSEVY